ncbi:MAG: hypothetical protein ACJAZO_003259, partial [Myxococcota bacterium]
MDSSRNVVIGAIFVVVAALLGGLVLWMTSPDTSVDVDLDVAPIAGVEAGNGAEPGGLIRGVGEGTGADGQPVVRLGPDGQPIDTAEEQANSGDDTGLTREGMIDEMIDDVAKDTGLDEEGRRRMEEALLRARDGAPAPAP